MALIAQGGGGGAAQAVNSTAGMPSLNALRGLPTQAVGPGLSPSYLSALASLTQQLPSGGMVNNNPSNQQDALNNFLAAEAQRQSVLHSNMGPPLSQGPLAVPQGAQTTAGPAQASLGDVLTSILGAAPQAPTAADFGPAPTLGDFFNAAPYQQALAQLSQGNQTAQGTIANAFNQAQQQQGQNVAVANAGTADALQREQAAAAQGTGAVNSDIANAQALGGPQMAAALAGLKATNTEQNTSTNNLDNVLAQVQRNNATQDTASLGSQRAAALQYLASQVLGGQNKIGLQQAADEAKAQQLLASATNTRNLDMSKALQQYNTANNAYNSRENTLVGGASKALGNTTPGGSGWAKGQLGQWAQQAGQGNQNAAFSLATAQKLIEPFTPPGATTQKNPTYADAVQRLMANANTMGGTNSIAYNVMSDWLNNYFGNTKHSALAAPQAPSSQAVAQYLQNTYLP